MKRKLIWMVALTALTLAAVAGPMFAGGVSCPYHYGSTCWPNGKRSPAGAKGYSCSCGDSIWAK